MDVVLLHSGLTDAREWDSVRRLLEPEHRVVTPELWQARPLVELALEAIPGERAALVGTSLGGRAALEAAAAEPERVEALVVIGANPFGWSDAVRAVGEEEDALCDSGRFDEAAALMVRAWLAGPNRSEDDVPPALRELVFAMQRRAYGLGQPQPGPVAPEDVRAPMLYVRGELDWPDVAHVAQRFEQAGEAVVQGAAHLPTLERPDEVARLILDFLSERAADASLRSRA